MGVTIVSEQRQHPEPKPTDGISLTRRGMLGGLAASAIPVLYGFESASSALAAPGSVAAATRPGSAANAGDELVRGGERRYHAPLLTPGTRVVLPADIKAVAVRDYYRRPHLAASKSAWPRVTASDGRTVDASIVPERGAPTRIAVLSGFSEGWYEVIHASGRADRVTWDARKLPFLWFYGEFGATKDAPYNRFYTLALEPFSRNPYSRNPLAV
jgi:hypothetical protein